MQWDPHYTQPMSILEVLAIVSVPFVVLGFIAVVLDNSEAIGEGIKVVIGGILFIVLFPVLFPIRLMLRWLEPSPSVLAPQVEFDQDEDDIVIAPSPEELLRDALFVEFRSHTSFRDDRDRSIDWDAFLENERTKQRYYDQEIAELTKRIARIKTSKGE